MKVSYKWLQTYFDEKLPSPDDLGKLLTFHAFEIEGIEEINGDSVIDVDILPNRSSDCLSHRGIAKEISVLLNTKLKDDPFKKELVKFDDSKSIEVNIEDEKLCSRYGAVVVNGVKIGASPKWLVEYLEALGQKSINNVVDATNYVMLNIGQPLHAFDMGKLKGDKKKITVRSAKAGEKITSLTGEEYELDESNLLITDGNSDVAIGIAGVKGGKVAEIDNKTKDIVIESANFNFVSVRKTSQKLKLWTDASIRFQNEPSAELVSYALRDVVALIQDIAGGDIEGGIDVYTGIEEKKPVSVKLSEINTLLGSDIKESEVNDIFDRFDFEYTSKDGVFTVTPPFERTDIEIKEDLIEEVGRVYGYKNVKSVPLSSIDKKPRINKVYYYASLIRSVLVEKGFSEVYTYTFTNSGDIEMENPLASDKGFLRNNLSDGISNSLDLNSKNVPLLGLERIKEFEIGTVFNKNGEYLSIAIGGSGKKVEKIINEVIDLLEEKIGKKPSGKIVDGILEFNLTDLVKNLKDPEEYIEFSKKDIVTFIPISPYPFMLRDIAVWVPSSVKEIDIVEIIKEKGSDLLIRIDHFDVFEKDDKTSYAFHLVFQSNKKTLSDEEVNKIMEGVTSSLDGHSDWEVR